MNRSVQPFTLIVVLFVVLSGVNQFILASEPSSEAAKESLKKQKFPWYDANKDEFRQMSPMKVVDPAHEMTSQNYDKTLFQTLQMILMWTLLIALLVAVATIAFRTMQDTLLDSPQKTATTRVSLEVLEALPEPVRNVQDLLGEATRLASNSDFESAIMFYFSWQLVQLDRRQTIELQKGKTNRQYRREVAASAPELLDLFTPSMRLFEDAFFGQLPVSRDDFMQVWEQRHRLQFTRGSHQS